MTWFTTHLALEGMIAFVFIGTALRSKFLHSNSTKALFLLTNTFAVIPDLDVYLGILFGNREHRGPSHSIFFPLSFVIIGLLILLYNKQQVKKIGNPLANIEKLFSEGNNDKWKQLLYLLPYVFFLAAFYWGMHIVLDQDAAEGGMMMFWPLDDRLYQIQLIFTLNANPFLIFPWQPLGASFVVSQSTIIGLYNYLFNWTPQDFINAYGTTIFSYEFVGLVLHSLILMSWVYFVLRPMWPFQGKHFSHTNVFVRMYIHVTSYWHAIIKEFLIPGLIIAIIGFSFGPLITTQVPDSQPVNASISLTNTSFNALSFFPISSINQPLDPNAKFFITLNYSAENFHSNDALYVVVALADFFSFLQQEVGKLANGINITNHPNNDTIFKQNYFSIINSTLELYKPDYIQSFTTNQSNTTINVDVPSSKNYGVGFVLQNWSSQQFWNETNTQLFITGNLTLTYTRYVNYWIGMVIELSGLILTLVALVLPFIKKRKSTGV